MKDTISKTLKGSNVYSDNANSKYTTSKRSNVYRNHIRDDDTTPKGSHQSSTFFFYKHLIPSGFLNN